MNKYNVCCPKCGSEKVTERYSYGGPAIYKKLVCVACNFEGGTSRVYDGEEERVEKEIVERFSEKRKDAVEDFISSII